MDSTMGVNLRVTGHCNQGGRKYMEDAFVVAYQQKKDLQNLEYAYFGIFDGHGGREAAIFAKEHLMDFIVKQNNFWSTDDNLVLKSIKDGFIAAHLAMWKEVGKWPKTMSGLTSTSGTTASVAFIKHGKMYVGHVGDSRIVLAYQDPGCDRWRARPMTRDHKPDSPFERERIYRVGGRVVNKAGVERVVWNRPRIGHTGPVRRSTLFDQIPFLAVARSLGDLWSYNYSEGEFVVSPEPDVAVLELDPSRDRCIILASDGLWNILTSWEAVSVVQHAEQSNEALFIEALDQKKENKPKVVNPSKVLVDRALSKWYNMQLRADNTSVVTVLLDPPGPPKSQVLLRKLNLQLKVEESEHNNNNNNNEPLMESKDTKEPVAIPPTSESRLQDLPRPIVLTPKNKLPQAPPAVLSLPTKHPGLGFHDSTSLPVGTFLKDVDSLVSKTLKEPSLYQNIVKHSDVLRSYSRHKIEDTKVEDYSCKSCQLGRQFPLVFGPTKNHTHTKKQTATKAKEVVKRKSCRQGICPTQLKHLRPHNHLTVSCRTSTTQRRKSRLKPRRPIY